MKFGLSSKDYSFIVDHVITPLKKENSKVWCFGSRAREDHQPFSDVDLLIEGQYEDLKKIVSEIKEKLEESNFPYKIDLVIESDLTQEYKNNINKDKRLFAAEN